MSTRRRTRRCSRSRATPASTTSRMTTALCRSPRRGRNWASTQASGWAELSRERQEALIRGEDIGLHIVLDYRLLPVERFHRADETHPVQHLVLTGELHL